MSATTVTLPNGLGLLAAIALILAIIYLIRRL